MSCKKILVLFVVIILVAVGVNFFLQEKTVEAPIIPNDEMLVGGDRDEHGCIGSAGYLWCETKGECLRPWEDQWDETCDTEEFSFEKDVIVVPEDGSGLVACTEEAKICLDGSAVGRSGPNCEFEKCPSEETE